MRPSRVFIRRTPAYAGLLYLDQVLPPAVLDRLNSMLASTLPDVDVPKQSDGQPNPEIVRGRERPQTRGRQADDMTGKRCRRTDVARSMKKCVVAAFALYFASREVGRKQGWRNVF